MNRDEAIALVRELCDLLNDAPVGDPSALAGVTQKVAVLEPFASEYGFRLRQVENWARVLFSAKEYTFWNADDERGAERVRGWARQECEALEEAVRRGGWSALN